MSCMNEHKLIIALIVFLPIITKAQLLPIINFDKSEIDYGIVPLGSDGVRYFKFKNIGKSALIIKNAVPSCGCTVPRWSTDPIKPNQTSYIEVKYDTNRAGAFLKTITVETNDITSPHKLYIRGVVGDKNISAGH